MPFRELLIWSTPLRHPSLIWPGLWREAWGRYLPDQEGSDGRVAPKPSATRVPAATGERAQFTRKRAADKATDDKVVEVMRAATKKAKSVAAPNTPPKAMPKTRPKAPQKPAAAAKAEPEGKPKSLPRLPKEVAADSQELNLTSTWKSWESAQAKPGPQPACGHPARVARFLAGLPMSPCKFAAFYMDLKAERG